MMSLKEHLLVRRLRERDEQAFKEAVRLYQHKVYNLVYRMVGNREEAEDVAQEVFVTVLKSIDTFRGDSKFSTWLYRIAANHTKNRMKYLGRRAYNSTSELTDATEREAQGKSDTAGFKTQIAAPDAVLEGLQMEQLVQEAIASLDEEHRVLVVLRDIESLSYEEIGAITGLNEGTVKSRLHRARMALKDYMAKRIEGD